MTRLWCRIVCFYQLFSICFCIRPGKIDRNVGNTTSVLDINKIIETIFTEHDEKSAYTDVSHDQSSAPIDRELMNQPQERMGTYCKTPNGDFAVCVHLQDCPRLMDQLTNKDAHPFLKASKCGPRNEVKSNPKVCCGKYNNYIEQVKQNVLPKNCGHQIPVIASRIVGGKKAQLGEFPWMARLIHKNSQTQAKTYGCSGFLIAAKYVLTAAHCLESDNIPLLGPVHEVQLGEHNVETEIDCSGSGTHRRCAEKPQVVRVKKIFVHPNYTMSSKHHHNDIGLVYLKKQVLFTNYSYPICLLDDVDFRPVEYWISGWGKTKKRPSSSIKMKVSLPVFPRLNCTERYGTIGLKIIEEQLCAGGKRNQDSCTGDSGGPLMVVNETNHWSAAGVVSFGLGCGQEGWPGVYTNVTSYLEWIESTILNQAFPKFQIKNFSK